MQGTNPGTLLFYSKIERALGTIWKYVKRAKEEATRATIIPLSDDSGFSSDEYEMRDIQHDNLDDEAFGFQPMNPKTFNIKNHILKSLKENQLSGKNSKDCIEHLTYFFLNLRHYMSTRSITIRHTSLIARLLIKRTSKRLVERAFKWHHFYSRPIGETIPWWFLSTHRVFGEETRDW